MLYLLGGTVAVRHSSCMLQRYWQSYGLIDQAGCAEGTLAAAPTGSFD
jgi:hypothetical protein